MNNKLTHEDLEQRVKELEERLSKAKQAEKKLTVKLTKANEQLEQEITRRKSAEKELIITEKKLSSIFDNANIMIWGCYDDGKLKLFNKEAERVLGYSQEEILGKMNMTLHPPEEREDILAKFHKHASGNDLNKYMELGVYTKDGRRLKGLLAQTTFKDSTGRDFYAVLVQDITDQKKAEEELAKHRDNLEELVKERAAELVTANEQLKREINERIKTEGELLRITKAVESASDAIGIADPQGHHFYQNQAFTDLFEYTVEEFNAAGGPAVVYVDPAVTKDVFEKIMDGKSWIGETEMVSKSERRFTVFLRADAIKDNDGNIIGLVGVHTDITERLQLEKQLRRSERLASMAELTSIIAHEIRNPLGAITNSVGVLKNNLELTGKQETLMRIVMEEAQRINMIIKDYLMFARLKESHLENCSITSLMQETLILLQEDEKFHSEIQIKQQYETDLPNIMFDPDQIRQVFWNVLINAIEAIPGKGLLKIKIKDYEYKEFKGALVEIIDTGLGIKPEIKDKIFDMFFTTKPDGSGLGLPIVQQIVDAHSGIIEIESQENTGTKFSLFLPRKHASNMKS